MREYLLNHIEIPTVISSAYSTEQAQQSILPKTGAMDLYSSRKIQRVFQAIRKTMLSRLTKHSVLPARKLSNVVYQITKSVYGLINIKVFL